VSGKSIRQPENAAYVVKQIEEAKQEIASKALFASPKEREAVLSVYEKGIRTCGTQVALMTTPSSDDTLRLSRDSPALHPFSPTLGGWYCNSSIAPRCR
jgi:hypothetical protein